MAPKKDTAKKEEPVKEKPAPKPKAEPVEPTRGLASPEGMDD